MFLPRIAARLGSGKAVGSCDDHSDIMLSVTSQGIRLLSQLGSGADPNETAISSLDRLLHELQPDSLHDARCPLHACRTACRTRRMPHVSNWRILLSYP